MANGTNREAKIVPLKKQIRMRKFREENGESVIPEGPYCYNQSGKCPYWELIVEEIEEGEYEAINENLEEYGYCWFLEKLDSLLLWDKCKICGIKEDYKSRA